MIAGTIPAVLLEAKPMEIYKVKSFRIHITGHFRENTILKWKLRWNDRGRWMARHIPNMNALVSVQRTAALRIVSAYRTVSTPAVLVIAGTNPVDLLAVERMEIYAAKSALNHITDHIRENTISKWQGQWKDDDRLNWSLRLNAGH